MDPVRDTYDPYPIAVRLTGFLFRVFTGVDPLAFTTDESRRFPAVSTGYGGRDYEYLRHRASLLESHDFIVLMIPAGDFTHDIP